MECFVIVQPIFKDILYARKEAGSAQRSLQGDYI